MSANPPQTLSRPELLERLAALIDGVRLVHPTRVAFDGPDAAGKTILADELAPVLRARGRHVIRASVDGFHRPRARRYARGPDSAQGYYHDSFDHDALRRALLVPLGPGGDLDYRRATFDHRADRPVAEPLVTAPADAVLLFDGVFLQRPELRPHFDLCVFVSVAFEETMRRALDRDTPLLGSREEIERRYRSRYVPGQTLYLAAVRPQELADVVVRNDDPAAAVLERVGGPALSPETGRPAR
jgi:uridine kinase